MILHQTCIGEPKWGQTFIIAMFSARIKAVAQKPQIPKFQGVPNPGNNGIGYLAFEILERVI